MVKQNVAKLIIDDEFIEIVNQNIKLLDPICELINISQKVTLPSQIPQTYG